MYVYTIYNIWLFIDIWLLVLSLLLWCIHKWYIPIRCIPISCLMMLDDTVLYHMFYCVILCICFKSLLMYICVLISIHWILLTVSKCAWDMSVTGLKLWKWAMNHQNKLFPPTAHEPSGVYLAPRAPTFHPWLTEERLVLARGGDHCWGKKTFYFNWVGTLQ